MFGMMQKTINAVAWFALTLFVLLTVTFFASEFNPIDPVLALVDEKASEAVYQKEKKRLELDQPVYVRYGRYLRNSLKGNFGKSFLTGHFVSQDLKRVFPLTLELATLALIIGVLVSLPLGALCAFYARGRVDRWISIVTFVGHSAPNFLIGYAILIISLKLSMSCGNVMPSDLSIFRSLLVGDIEKFRNTIGVLLPPAIALSYFSASYIVRMMRGFTLDELSENYYITAKIKGIAPLRIFFKHLLPNILPRLIPVLTFSYTALLEGSIVTEMVFALPGVGSYLVRSVLNHDSPAIMGTTIMIGAAILLVNMLADLLVVMVNPWLRHRR